MRNRTRHTLRKIEGREERGNDFWGSAVDMAEFNGNARSVIRRRTYTYIYMCVSFELGNWKNNCVVSNFETTLH